MALDVPSKVIRSIWEALSRPLGAEVDLSETWLKVTRDGWAFDIDVEDTLYLADRRLAFVGLKPKALASILDLPWRYIYPRPENRFDESYGHEALAATDLAALLILLQRLGFAINPEPLCANLRPGLKVSSLLSWAAIEVLFHDKAQHRTSPLTLSASDINDWRGSNIQRLKTPLGYRIEFSEGDDGTAMWLTVSSPKYRKRPEPKSTKCPQCSLTYMRGLPSDEKEHRTMHRIRMAVLDPTPNRQFIRAKDRDDLSAPWVDYASAKWKRELMYRRAFAFKREFGYSFSQWALDPAHDFEAVGFLFSDDEGRVIGAAAFRHQVGGVHPWRLDWVWMAPDFRRRGYLSRHWAQFEQRFGEFDIEPPVSTAMQTFLRKRGLGRLIGE